MGEGPGSASGVGRERLCLRPDLGECDCKGRRPTPWRPAGRRRLAQRLRCSTACRCSLADELMHTCCAGIVLRFVAALEARCW